MQQMEPGRTIHQLVHTRDRERVFGTCSVEISLVDTHSPFFVAILDEDDVGKPCNVLDFFNKTC